MIARLSSFLNVKMARRQSLRAVLTLERADQVVVPDQPDQAAVRGGDQCGVPATSLKLRQQLLDADIGPVGAGPRAHHLAGGEVRRTIQLTAEEAPQDDALLI